MRRAAVALAVAVLLAACGRAAPSQRYETILDLRAAAVSAGMQCPQWRVSIRHDGSQLGTCSATAIVVLFDDAEQRDAAVEDLRQTLERVDLPFTVLVGENWMIDAPEVPQLAGALGGSLVSGG